MITFTTSGTDKELNGILHLQKANLLKNLTQSESLSQGFVTVSHTLEDLKKLNDYEQQLIIKDEDQIVGYLLAMTNASRNDIPILIPMFDLFDSIVYKEKLISAYKYIVVGQACIQKEYRGKGLLDKSYSAYKTFFKDKYDFAITEIALNNTRSLNAHKRIGFVELKRTRDINNMEWIVVIWEWK